MKKEYIFKKLNLEYIYYYLTKKNLKLLNYFKCNKIKMQIDIINYKDIW
jgi:hypothetical protein